MRSVFIVLASLVALAGPVGQRVAVAQPKVSKKDKEKAKALYKEGLDFNNQKDYEHAAEKYKEAYALVPSPGLLYNLAQVYRLNGDRRLAIQYYQRYLEDDPDGKVAGKAKERLQELNDQLKKEQLDAKRQADEEARRKREQEAKANTKANKREDPKVDPEPEEVPDDDEEIDVSTPGKNPGRAMRWAGVGTAIAGAISIGIGIKFGLDARRLSDELSANDGPWTPELLAKVPEGESANTKMIVFTALGSAAVVGGGVMYFLGHRAGKASREQGVAFVPNLAADNVGVVMSGRF